MANEVVVGLGFVAMAVMGAAVLGTVDRRERFAFVLGVALALGGLSLLPGTAGGLVAFVGFVLVAASTVPMLFESPKA